MKKAFTLVEILMGLAIVGVISALIVPIIFNTYENKVMSAQLKKTCVQITNAAKHIIVDEHANDVDELSSDMYATNDGFYATTAGVKTSSASKGAQFFLENYIKHISSNCGQGGAASVKCVGSTYKSSSGTSLGTFPTNYYCVKTNNGSTICMRFNTSEKYSVALMDVNGAQRPNIVGKDVFVVKIEPDGHLTDLLNNANKCGVSSTIQGESNNVVKYAAGCFYKMQSTNWKILD